MDIDIERICSCKHIKLLTIKLNNPKVLANLQFAPTKLSSLASGSLLLCDIGKSPLDQILFGCYK